MLSGDLYTIPSFQKENNAARAVLLLNNEHAIFDGHFPGRPVLPGACQLQIVKEVLQSILTVDVELVKAHQIKFLSLIIPDKVGVLQVHLTYNTTDSPELHVTASITNDAVTCFKFNGTFRVYLRDVA